VSAKSQIKPLRYLRVSFFFFRAFAHVFFWDVLLNRNGLRWLRTTPRPRWLRIAQRFRKLAIRNGGVLIKLGQFLSIRVDILPEYITHELRGLQDKLPAEDFGVILKRIEEELGATARARFEDIERVPLGAASLAQVHRVTLTDGASLVLKISRPGIEDLVETDLAASRLACQWLKWYRPLASKVDLDWLIREFESVTRTELDLIAEGAHLERFRTFFAGKTRLCLPHQDPSLSTRRVLALENVAFIKIDARDQLEAVGIDPAEVADALFQIHMTQIFHQHFVHADPHPGNVFVRPLPTEDERAGGRVAYLPGEVVPRVSKRDFQIVLIDFGMVSEIPARLRQSIRTYALGFATRDAAMIVQSYVQAGTLLPGADLQRLEDAHEALLERVWGRGNDELQDAAGDAFALMMGEYKDILFDTPFQAQVDLLFTVRSVEILNGVVTRLQPRFNLWQALTPFARSLATDDDGMKDLGKKAIDTVRTIAGFPSRIDRVLTQAERGNLVVRNALTPDTRRLLLRIDGNLRSIRRALLVAALLIGGILLRSDADAGHWDTIMIGLAILGGLRLWFGR